MEEHKAMMKDTKPVEANKPGYYKITAWIRNPLNGELGRPDILIFKLHPNGTGTAIQRTHSLLPCPYHMSAAIVKSWMKASGINGGIQDPMWVFETQLLTKEELFLEVL